MNSKSFTPSEEKVVTSVALEKSVRDWIDREVPEGKRSEFINDLARRYINRRKAQEQRQQMQVTA